MIVNNENFNDVINQDKLVLLDFYATWCGPCKMLTPIIHQIENEYPNIIVGSVDVDENQELARYFSIESVPTLVVIKDKKIINKAIGYMPKDKVLRLIGAK